MDFGLNFIIIVYKFVQFYLRNMSPNFGCLTFVRFQVIADITCKKVIEYEKKEKQLHHYSALL